jgi:hypothetical protein
VTVEVQAAQQFDLRLGHHNLAIELYCSSQMDWKVWLLASYVHSMMRRLGLTLLWQGLHQHLEQKQYSQPESKNEFHRTMKGFHETSFHSPVLHASSLFSLPPNPSYVSHQPCIFL